MDRKTPDVEIAVTPITTTMSQARSSPYMNTDDDITPISSPRRVSSWGSEDTFIRESASLRNKGDDRSAIDFDFAEDDAYITRPRRRPWIKFAIAFIVTLLTILLALDILLRVSKLAWRDGDDDGDAVLSGWGQQGTGTEQLSWYPTNFLQDVMPKPIHSHNDYWRKVPLFTAIRQGATGVEADVWLFNETAKRDTLYVGHVEAALQPARTFQSLYIQPIVEILERQNPETEFYNGTWRGVFDTNPNQTLTLLVDVKTAGPSTWAEVVKQLEPLRKRGWLTYYANGTVHERPVTVVGTGNTPFADLIANQTYRDYFYDAPLQKINGTGMYNNTNSLYASVSFKSTIGTPWMGGLGAEQMERIRSQIRQAHGAGLKARYWDLPSWPVSTRNHIWDILVQEGVDMLNVDDVKAAARRDWRN